MSRAGCATSPSWSARPRRSPCRATSWRARPRPAGARPPHRRRWPAPRSASTGRDGAQRLGRPRPRRRRTPRAADPVRPGHARARRSALAAGLTAAGLGRWPRLAGGRRALAVAVPLAGAVWAYDLAPRTPRPGPAGDGRLPRASTCCSAPAGRPAGAVPAALTVGAHTYRITALSRREVHGADARPRRGRARRDRRRGRARRGCPRAGRRRPAPSPGGGRLSPALRRDASAGAQAGAAADPPTPAKCGAAVGAGIARRCPAAGGAGSPRGRRPGCAGLAARGRAPPPGWRRRWPAAAVSRRHERPAAVRLRHQRLRQPPARRRLASSPTSATTASRSPSTTPPRPVRRRPGRAQVARGRPRGSRLGLGRGHRDRRPLPARPLAQARARRCCTTTPDRRLDFLRRADRRRRRPRRRGGLVLGRRPARRRVDPATAWDRLVAGVRRARRRTPTAAGVRAAASSPSRACSSRPSPTGPRLHAARRARRGFGITLDIGHCRCLEPAPVPTASGAAGRPAVNVQIDDMRRGVHEHLEFGDGRDRLSAGAARRCASRLPRAGRGRAAPALARRARVAARSIDFLRAAERDRAADRTRRGADADPTSAAPARLDPAAERLARALAPCRRRPADCGAGRRGGRRLGCGFPLRPGARPGSTRRARGRRRAARAAAARRAAPTRPGRAGCGELYRYGDAAEQRAVLRALPLLPRPAPAPRSGCCTTRCAPTTPGWSPRRSARTPRAPRPTHAWRQGVLKCVFMASRCRRRRASDARADAELRRACSPRSPTNGGAAGAHRARRRATAAGRT